MSLKMTRNFLIGLSFLLLATSLSGLVLSEFGSTDSLLIIQDVSDTSAAPAILGIQESVKWLHNTSSFDFQLDSFISGIGTSIVLPTALSNSLMPGSLVLALGTISLERRDQRLEKLRNRVVDEISLYPGIHLRELHRSIGCAMGALQYHLGNLEKEGIIISIRNGNARHLFINGYSSDEQELKLASFARNPTIHSILQECASNGRITQAELSRTLAVDKSLISYYVSSLVKADILNTIRVFGRERPLILSDWARSSILSLGLLVQ